MWITVAYYEVMFSKNSYEGAISSKFNTNLKSSAFNPSNPQVIAELNAGDFSVKFSANLNKTVE